jgi:hypothetical protein
MNNKARDLETLERDYQERKAQIRADNSLSWEKKEQAIRELGLRFDKDRNQLESGEVA